MILIFNCYVDVSYSRQTQETSNSLNNVNKKIPSISYLYYTYDGHGNMMSTSFVQSKKINFNFFVVISYS